MKKLYSCNSISIAEAILFNKLLLISLLCFFLFFNRVDAQGFSGGTGTYQDPYQIVTAGNLNSVRYYPGAGIYFKQMNDIDLTTYLASGGAGYAAWGTDGWLPIGDETINFLGNYDGNNNKIIGLNINRIGSHVVGLFGYTGDGATLKNIGVVIAAIDNGWHSGGLVGSNHAVITDCYVTGSINGNERIGGLVGINNDSITDCYSTAFVFGDNYVGGLVADNAGILTNCHVKGVITSYWSVSGGLVAYNSGTITNCYATGAITGDMKVGGLVGTNGGTISNSYTSVTLYGNVNVGGLVGVNLSDITNCYSTGDVSSYRQSSYGGLVGWNSGSITNCYATGSVYGISGISGTKDTGGLVGTNGGTINNCYATGAVSGYQEIGGLVGINSGTITNCNATGTVTGDIFDINKKIGGLVGINSGPITNCYARGTVYGNIDAGGLAGYNNNTITNCYATGAVSGNTGIGGLVGNNDTGGVVNGSYWDKETTGQTTSSGSGVAYGKTTAEMKMRETFVGWDFTTIPIWKIKATINNGYPSFAWQIAAPIVNVASNITINSFTTNWSASTGATKYHLDVATDEGFTSFVSGYNDLNVGDVVSYNVMDLSIGTNYYYRVRAYNNSGESENSLSMLVTTNKISQIITFTLSEVTYGVPLFIINASGGASGNPVTFTSSDNTVATCTGTNGETITVLKVGPVIIYADQAGDETYAAAPTVCQNLTINPKPLTVTGATVNNKEYDGITDATITGGSLDGVVSPDVVAIIAGTGVFADKNAGTNKTVIATGYALSGIDADNYTLSAQPSGITADITARPLVITATAGQTKEAGEADPVFSYTITSSSLVTGDVLSGTLSRIPGETEGNYPIVIGTLSAGDNYNILFISADFVITLATGIESLVVNEVGFYPNPTNGILTINANEGQIKVLNMQGKVIIETQISENNNIDICNQPAGTYILILTTKKSVHRYKIIKE